MPTKAELEEEVEKLEIKTRELNKDRRELRAEFAKRDVEHTSASGRTTIKVELLEDGRFIVTVDRDGMRVHRIDGEKEPILKVGT